MVNESTDTTVRYRRYALVDTEIAWLDETVIAGALGARPDAAAAGADLVVSWSGSADGQVTRFPFATGPTGYPLVDLSARTEVVVANHPASDVVGVITFDSSDAAELGRYTASSYEIGQYAATYSATASALSIAGTDSGWVVGWLDGDVARLSSFDAGAKTVATEKLVTSSATHLSLAAIGNQLGVAWLSPAGAVHLRPLDASLDAL
jgi:hypothetical protein